MVKFVMLSIQVLAAGGQEHIVALTLECSILWYKPEVSRSQLGHVLATWLSENAEISVFHVSQIKIVKFRTQHSCNDEVR